MVRYSLYPFSSRSIYCGVFYVSRFNFHFLDKSCLFSYKKGWFLVFLFSSPPSLTYKIEFFTWLVNVTCLKHVDKFFFVWYCSSEETLEESSKYWSLYSCDTYKQHNSLNTIKKNPYYYHHINKISIYIVKKRKKKNV